MDLLIGALFGAFVGSVAGLSVDGGVAGALVAALSAVSVAIVGQLHRTKGVAPSRGFYVTFPLAAMLAMFGGMAVRTAPVFSSSPLHRAFADLKDLGLGEAEARSVAVAWFLTARDATSVIAPEASRSIGLYGTPSDVCLAIARSTFAAVAAGDSTVLSRALRNSGSPWSELTQPADQLRGEQLTSAVQAMWLIECK